MEKLLLIAETFPIRKTAAAVADTYLYYPIKKVLVGLRQDHWKRIEKSLLNVTA